MKKFLPYAGYVLLPVALLLAECVLYRKITCSFSGLLPAADLICQLNCRDGFILAGCFMVTMFLGPLLELDTVGKRLVVTLGFYSIAIGAIDWSLVVDSILQPLAVNTFLHFLFFILLNELLFYPFRRESRA